MNDQAGSLRQIVDAQHKGQLPSQNSTQSEARAPGDQPQGSQLPGSESGMSQLRCSYIIVVTGGKGAVGKTSLSLNLAVAMACLGNRVTVLDVGTESAISTLLGIQSDAREALSVPGDTPHVATFTEGTCSLKILHGGDRVPDFVHDTSSNGSCGLLVIDAGEALKDGASCFLKAADLVIVVTTPELSAITDAYAAIKVTKQENPSSKVGVVINMVSSESEGRSVVARLNLVAVRFLGDRIHGMGFVPRDPLVMKSAMAQRPFILANPDAPSSLSVKRLAQRVSSDMIVTEGVSDARP